VGEAPSDSDPADPPTPAIYDGRALLAEDPAAARAHWEALATTHPGSVAVARGLQDADRALLDPQAFVDRYTAGEGSEALDWYLHGRARIGEPAAARDGFDRALQIEPAHAWSVTGRAFLFYARGDLFQALKEYEQATEQAPHSRTLRQNAAGLYLELRLHLQAQRHLEKAHRLAPDDATVVAALGQAYYGLGYTERAIEWLERARATEPRIGELYPSLAALYLRTDRPAEAHEAYVRGLELGQEEDVELAIEIRIARVAAGLL
jgi:tetratricopeptide (TPR) repeat protein